MTSRLVARLAIAVEVVSQLTLPLTASCTPASSAPAAGPAAPGKSAATSGKATYYADSLAGRPTASGEPYDPAAFTAAHRTLPFGTWVLVSRPGKGSVRVRINDRGPFGKSDRIIDLSRRAAEQIDLLRDGVATVTITVVDGP
jgi:rare lipoprotein A